MLAMLPPLLVLSAPSRAGAAPPDDLARAAADHLARAELAEAADAFEQLARAAPADAAAHEALADAALLRLGLGQTTEADADAAELEHAWAGKHPELIARVTLVRARRYAGLEQWEELRALLVRAMPAIDRRGAPEARLEVHGLLGRALVRLDKRADAAREYALVLALARGRDLSERGADAVGEARFFSAEEERTKAEQIMLPPYTGRPRDRDAVLAYLKGPALRWSERRRYANELAERAYARVLGVELPAPEPPKPPPPPGWGLLGDPSTPVASWSRDEPTDPASVAVHVPSPRWAVAASGRVGGLWAAYVSALRSFPILWTPVPALPVEPGSVYFYTPLDSPSEMYKQRAKAAFEVCLRVGLVHHVADEHTRSCEIWLSRNYAAEYHLTEELLPRIAAPIAAGPFAPLQR